MARRRAPKKSALINTFGWVLLVLILASGVVALFTFAGPSEIAVGSNVTLKTSSAALIVMVFCSVCLLTLVGLAAKGEIQLFERGAGPQPGFFERHRASLMIFAGVLAAVGVIILVIRQAG